MAQVLGYKSRLVADFETTWGQDPASPAGIVLPINRYSLAARQNKIHAQTLNGSRNPVKPINGNLEVSGEAIVPLCVNSIGYWFKAMFGAPTTTGVGPYQHVFKVGDGQLSMVNDLRYANAATVVTYAKYSGVKTSGFSMDLSDGDTELMAKIGLEAANETLSTSAYGGTLTTPSLLALSNFDATIEEGGSTLAKCTAIDFSINFNLLSYYAVGSGIRAGISEGILGVSGNVTTIFEDLTLLNKAINSTESSIVIEFASGTNVLEIAFNEVIFERNTPGIEGPQGILISLPFVAYTDDDAAASCVVATLTNGVASY
ncbi:phage tail tube protein [Desulfatitalea tepidiphila]|uniref:phage tail tube protein n=1 Tax=Desulfatitalea tepidiphila TaxID=1185843 RepID=UPI0006B66BC0|nr:phage tail tube protein [Desulfatitalea tepidiphila]